MALRNPKPWIDCAQRDGFAVGAFNANTLEQIQGIVQAAQAEDAPAIIQVSHNALLYAGSGNATLGLRYMAAAGKIAAQSVEVPIALHLDHATESEVVQAPTPTSVPCQQSQGNVSRVSFESAELGEEFTFSIYTPPCYDAGFARGLPGGVPAARSEPG